MSDRIYAYTVILEGAIKDEDAQPIEDAIAMIKGVAKVTPQVADSQLYFATETAKREISEKLFKVIYDKE